MRFLVQRILTIVPTLIGVTLASFILLVVAPPPDSSTGASDEEWRRELFLDLPLFVNPAPRDLKSSVEASLDSVAAGASADDAGHALSPRGAALIPHLVPRLGALGPRARAFAIRALSPLVEVYDDGSLPTTDAVAFWSDVYEARRLDFRPTHVRRLVRRLEGGRSHHATAQLRLLGTYGLDELFAELGRRGTSTSVRERIVRLLAEIVPEAAPSRLDATRKESADAWREWWFVHRTDYVQLTETERWFGTFMETRYGRWIARLTTFRLGVSWRDGMPVTTKLAARIPVTLTLTALATLLAALLAIPTGVIAASRHGRAVDRMIGVGSLLLYSVPTVWFATLVAQSSDLRTGGSSQFETLGQILASRPGMVVLAIICLAYPPLVSLSRQQRTALLAVVRTDFVRTARAKGLPERVVFLRHALRNALLPVVTLAGLQLPMLLGSAIIVEDIFGLPGVGMETLEAVRGRDVPWLLAVTVFGALLTIASVFITDLVCLFVDPRTRRARSVTRGMS